MQTFLGILQFLLILQRVPAQFFLRCFLLVYTRGSTGTFSITQRGAERTVDIRDSAVYEMSELQKEEVPTTVIPFSEVMAKSKCQPMQHLVYVYHEFPESVDTIYMPDCVVLRRCSGYSQDEAMECYPTLERNITLQLKIFSIQQPVVELTFVEHQSCGYRPHQNLQNYEQPVIKSQQQQQQVYQEQTFQEES